MDIYVGNLPYSIDEGEIRDAFQAYGSVDKVNIIVDRETGQSKGFAFVTMSDDDAAREAIEALNESELAGRPMRVNEARAREERAPRGDRPSGGSRFGGGRPGGGNRFGGDRRGGSRPSRD